MAVHRSSIPSAPVSTSASTSALTSVSASGFGAERSAALSAFTEEVFGHLPRQDQRRWAETYVKGLLGTPGRKSVRRMAAAVSAAPTASQSLHQFVSESPWPWEPSRRALARWAGERAPVLAWTLSAVVAPKRGGHSVGVHRRFDEAAGRLVNCQVGMGIHVSTRRGDVPVDWRLHLPEAWCGDPHLRRRARIPDSADARPLWGQALGLVEALAGRTAGDPPPVVADGTELDDCAALAAGLSGRSHRFLVTVPGNLAVHAGPALGAQRHPRGPAPAERLCVDDHLLQRGSSLRPPAPPRRLPGLPGRGSGGPLWTLSGPVHLPHSPHTLRLLAQWRPRRDRPARIWLTNLVHARPDELLPLVDAQARTGAAVDALCGDFGLLDFEGRSFPGWHHHTTLVSAAYGWHALSGAPTDPDGHRPARPAPRHGPAVPPRALQHAGC
ncbi:IS701 family transposase [Streptomyces sp. NPDC093225]|uniref:IS701 family transposase n=1 Tax=Streptomyces sp. NPDC093225 TaxID=3366034 RepID=UPI00381B760D